MGMGAPLRRKARVTAAATAVMVTSACSSVTRLSAAQGQRVGTTGRTSASGIGAGNGTDAVGQGGAGTDTAGATPVGAGTGNAQGAGGDAAAGGTPCAR